MQSSKKFARYRSQPSAFESLEIRSFRSVTSFTVDATRTTLTLSGEVTDGGTSHLPLLPQTGASTLNAAENSLTTHLAGVVSADVGTNTLQILPGSALTAQVNGKWQPGSSPAPDGSNPANALAKADANFGVFLTSFGFTEYVAARGVAFSLNSQPLTNNGSGFEVGGPLVNVSTTAGKVFYDGSVSIGMDDLTGGPAANNEATNLATLATVGTTQTLTVPIVATFTSDVGSGLTMVLHYGGQVVATRAVPEPTFLGVISVGVLTLLRRRVRRTAPAVARRRRLSDDIA